MNYYNEHDKHAASWLRQLIDDHLIPAGEVDERSIVDVKPSDLSGFTQCHFFAGIGGWSHALRLSGWPDDKPVWTGSCPCQPFSQAGNGAGFDDERHLWPAFRWLIAQCRPTTVFGEQVASNLGREWFDGVRTDLEAMGYAVGGADLCAASVGAPHRRQRLWWVADTNARGWSEGNPHQNVEETRRLCVDKPGTPSGMAHSHIKGSQVGCSTRESEARSATFVCGAPGAELANANNRRCQQCDTQERELSKRDKGCVNNDEKGACPLFWKQSIRYRCRDGKTRRIAPQSRLFPLAYGIPGRVALLRGAGNAIVPQVAQVFIESFMEEGSQNG